MRVKRMTAWMLVMILGICTLTACGGEETAEVEEKEKKVESSADVQAFAGSNWQIWNDSWREETASGGAVDVKINGYIRIPEFEHMSAVEVRRYEFSQENKKNLLEGIFGSEIYDGSMDKMPKSVLRRYIKETEELIRDTRDAIEDIQEKKDSDWKELLKDEREDLRLLERDKAENEKRLEKAPDDFVKIKEADYNETYYVGKINGIPYTVLYEDETSDDEETEGAREFGKISIVPLDESDLAPEDVKGDNVYWQPVETGELANQCSIKKEDAEQMALDFLAKAGFQQTGQGDVQTLVPKKAGSLSWGDGNSEKMYYNGWYFEFGPGINDTMFKDFGCDSSYVLYKDGNNQGDEYSYDRYSMDCKVEVAVTDAGIVYAKWNNPVDIVSATQNVKLLSPEMAMDIMKNGMNEFASFAWEKGQPRINFKRLLLTYYRVSDPDDRNLFTYIPAWCLLGDNIANSFAINAMDGSVIKDWESTWGVYMLNDLETGQTY